MFLTKCLLQGVMVSMLLAISCLGITITVDDDDLCADFNAIQDAVDCSWRGDVVLVYPGTYNESVYFDICAITLTSPDPCDPCVVSAAVIQANISIQKLR